MAEGGGFHQMKGVLLGGYYSCQRTEKGMRTEILASSIFSVYFLVRLKYLTRLVLFCLFLA